ncbi:hypothetical protein HW45_03195 [Vibrio sp. ER1A]|nr:hypothetical protein HW45_03195 [Vibrio sp. ER1A]
MNRKYSGHTLNRVRDFTKPNFSLGSRDMEKALINASLEQQGGVKNNTHRSRLAAIRDFSAFLKVNTRIKRLNHIDKTTVLQYGEQLQERYEVGTLSPVTARDYLSHINRTLAQARGDETCVVRATADLGFVPKSGVAQTDGSIAERMHECVLNSVSEELGLIIQLQRKFGMRFREACLHDAQQSLRALAKNEIPTISRGTKGGQSRSMPVENTEQYNLLVRVAAYQKEHKTHTLIPDGRSFKSFQSYAWRETKAIDALYLTHGERKFFATEFYARKIGVRCPVQSGISHGKDHFAFIAKELAIPIEHAQSLDRIVRLELSELLGHHRVEITNAYLG